MNANTISRPRTVTMQRMQITIRQAGVEDHERLSSLARETFVDSFAADNQDMAAYLEKAFSPRIQATELAERQCRAAGKRVKPAGCDTALYHAKTEGR